MIIEGKDKKTIEMIMDHIGNYNKPSNETSLLNTAYAIRNELYCTIIKLDLSPISKEELDNFFDKDR